MPIVSITIVNCGCPMIGRITNRSSAVPSMNIATTAAGAANQNDQPCAFISTNPPKAPSIISSPWAKLTVSVAL